MTTAQPPDPPGPAAEGVLADVFRREHGRVLSVLVHDLGDIDLAEEALADALAQAATAWRDQGIPDRPAGWLLVAARRRAVDRLRRADAQRRALTRLAPEVAAAVADAVEAEADVDPYDPSASSIPDERLRLLFTCCHPALAPAARIALTLRTVAGLTEAEIARAFLVTEPAMARRLTRARRKIRDARIPYRVPADRELPDRLTHVLRVVELVFNEGYLATEGRAVVRVDLAEEAIRLARTLLELLPDEAEVQGLLAMLLLQHARTAARTDAAGRLVLLEDQDRDRWDAAAIEEGTTLVASALRRRTPGPYQLQAAIAALHSGADRWETTDWPQIAALYGALLRHRPEPVVALNRAVAVAYAHGPRAGLRLLDELDAGGELDGYHLLHATRGELLLRAEEPDAAAAAFERALALVHNDAERTHLEARHAAAVGGPRR